jgi:3-methylcrotonyl-CoA carboxylase alpha subunit
LQQLQRETFGDVTMFDTILIANRGEIACRIIRTARRLGIRTVAVFSDADAAAPHVDLADAACRIGPAPARESYLCPDPIIDAALRFGAQGIHPGYGFLSENAAFAEACADAGLVFIGPPPDAIRAMGSKSAAKQIMDQAGVPLVPGYHGMDQAPEVLRDAAGRIGYPVMIKASAGGGGKGMRVVRDAATFDEALAAAKREALAGFGDDRILLEKYLPRPRHVEIQVFADSCGSVLHLFERDCSIQRRHQKILEEAPAPGLDPELRSRMGAAAVAAARAIGYVGAGTVEFLLDEDGSFYFMEMNTRLQVEHPVTEMITGQDLVEWQFMVACGRPLPYTQDQLSISGHAMEARIYAEDPQRGFLPATGTLRHLRTPRENAHVRIDSGVREGGEIGIHYDPMLAKLIVWDRDRDGVLRRMAAALREFQVVGVTTNLEFLAALVSHPAFAAAELDTGFIDRHRAELFPESSAITDQVLALASLDVLLRRSVEAEQAAAESADPWSPWHQTSGWRMNVDNHHVLNFRDREANISIVAHYRPDGYLLELPGGGLLVMGSLDDNGDLLADLGGARCRATVVHHGGDLVIVSQGRSRCLSLHDPLTQVGDEEVEGGRLTAPMPGRIVAVLVEPGATIAKGTPLVIMEAMKMEYTIAAPRDGVVAEIHYAVGAVVNEGAELLAFSPAGETP